LALVGVGAVIDWQIGVRTPPWSLSTPWCYTGSSNNRRGTAIFSVGRSVDAGVQRQPWAPRCWSRAIPIATSRDRRSSALAELATCDGARLFVPVVERDGTCVFGDLRSNGRRWRRMPKNKPPAVDKLGRERSWP
jgi:hypothetical protein